VARHATRLVGASDPDDDQLVTLDEQDTAAATADVP
jgi:hypothetical protein